MAEAAHILQRAGNQVTVIDVGTESRDPTTDHWEAYDQVWDARILHYGSYGCDGSPGSADYFGDRWQVKAVDYLNHCGKLFLVGECCHFVDRDQGLYEFLQKINAVEAGFSACAPSALGNDETKGQAFYPVENGLGPVSVYLGWAGGIPLNFLTGSSYVNVDNDWKFNNGVNRSILCSWTGDQLGGAIQAPNCTRGKLFVVWDTHPWVWPKWVPAGSTEAAQIADISRDLTLAIAQWLGRDACPCASPVPKPVQISTPSSIVPEVKPNKLDSRPTPPPSFPVLLPTAIPTPTPRPVPSFTPFQPFTPTPFPVPSPLKVPVRSRSVKIKPTPTFVALRPTATPRLVIRPNFTATWPTRSKPTSVPTWLPPLDLNNRVELNSPPANIYFNIADGPGRYQVEVVDSAGNLLVLIFDENVVRQGGKWLEWNGQDSKGRDAPPGQYFVVIYKDGKPLKSISVVFHANSQK